MDQFLNIVAVSRSIEPFDPRLSSKPGQLTFRISTGITLNYTYRFVATGTRIEIRQYMPVTNRFERFRASRQATLQQVANFTNKPSLEHFNNPFVDTLVQLFAIRVEPDEMHREAGQRIAGLRLQMLGQRLAGLKPNF